MSRWLPSGRDIRMASVGFGAVFLLVYLVGRLILPSSGPGHALLEIPAGEPGTNLIDELRMDLVGIIDDVAVIEWSGVLDGRSVLDQVSVPYVYVPAGPELDAYEPDGPVDVHVNYSSGGRSLSLVADQAVSGSTRTEALTIVFTIDGQSFTARSGDCTLELSRSGYSVDGTPTGAAGLVLATPHFAGLISCTDVADIRSDDTLTFSAVFRYEVPTD